MTLPAPNDDSVRWKKLAEWFPDGIDVIVSENIPPGMPGRVRFGKAGRYNTVERADHIEVETYGEAQHGEVTRADELPPGSVVVDGLSDVQARLMKRS